MEQENRTGKTIEVLPAGTISAGLPQYVPTNAPGPFIHYKRRQVKKHRQGPRIVYMQRRHGASDYIPYEIAELTGSEEIHSGSRPQVGFFIIFMINTGCRAGDTFRLTHGDLCTKKAGYYMNVFETKTKKTRQVQLNEKVITAYQGLISRYDSLPPKEDYIFTSQKGTVYRLTSINDILKETFRGCGAVNISTHSLRKAFGRRVYDMHGQTDYALTLLSDIFKHVNLSVTRRYLGLRKDEISSVYLAL